MARINIEDSLFRDHRFMDFIIKMKNPDAALGALVRAWILAQKWYLTPEKTIPIADWEKQRLPSEIIEVGLAEISDGKVRVVGIDDQFAWLEQRVIAGRKGGLSAKKNSKHSDEESIKRNGARTILNRAVADGKVQKPTHCEDCGRSAKIIEGHHSDYSKPLDVNWLCKACHTRTHRDLRNHSHISIAGAQRSEAVAEQTAASESLLSPSLSPFSLSSSESDSGSNSKNLATGSARASATSAPIWEAYSEAYEKRWREKPVRNARVNAQLKQFSARVPALEAPAIAAFYVSHPDSFYVKAMHPVSLLLRDAEKLRTEWATGRQVTATQARHAETMGHYESQMNRIAKGEL